MMPIRFSSKAPFLQRVPDPLRLFGKSGSVDSIFRPRVLGNGVFAINTGYGVSFTLAGIDSEGLNRRTLDLVSQQIAIANRVLPPECQLFEYLMTAYSDDIPARPIKQEVVRRQADERSKFLKEKARFKSIRVMVTLYLPGKVAEDGDDFTQKSRSALRKLQAAALLYEQQLHLIGIKRLNQDELVQIYSFLLNLDRSLLTRKAAAPGETPKKLGKVSIGVDGDYLRVGRKYCQVLSLVERPRGTRPDLWGAVTAIDCEMVFCSVWQRKPGKETRTKAAAVENAIGMATSDLWAAAVGGYNPNVSPPPKASTFAQEDRVKQIGGVLSDVDGSHYYGHYSLFALVHSHNREEIEAALPRIQNVLSDPSEAGLLEERRGAVSAYLFLFSWAAVQHPAVLVAWRPQSEPVVCL